MSLPMKIHRNWMVLGAALVVGVIAAFTVQRYIKDRMAAMQPRTGGETVSLVVANTQLSRGTRLDAGNVAVRKVPREWAHSQAIKPTDFDRIETAVLATGAAPGEAILWSQLEGKPSPSFSSRLAVGRRAVTVPVDEISSISGMVAPGDAIDLMAALRQEGKVVMLPVLQDVKVLATGTQVQPGKLNEDGKPRSYTTVTLDATPEDARRIMAAREVGKLTALLRAPGDTGQHGLRRTEALAVLGLSAGGAGPAGVPVFYGARGPAMSITATTSK